MPFIQNPVEKTLRYFISIRKELVVTKKGALPDYHQFKSLAELPHTEIFADSNFDYTAMDLCDYAELPEEFTTIPIRQFMYEAPEEEAVRASRSRSILKWHQSMKFCPACGTMLIDSNKLDAKVCGGCKKEYFPRIEPAVIVLVRKGDEILLVRHTYRMPENFICVAGFMEAGETAEHAVARELMEETGIKVKNILYKGTQSWPFPDQLMLAFTAEYESGEFKLQKEELAEARWFHKNHLPEASAPEGSVAWKLIHDKF